MDIVIIIRIRNVFLLVLQVCFFVALYYNVIISWSLFYFSQSFQHPLPWQECPLMKNKTLTCKLGATCPWRLWRRAVVSLAVGFTDVVPECEKSSATTYYWYRKALDISDSISESGGVNWKMALSLLAGWILVCLAMIKGIKSSGKVVFLSTSLEHLVNMLPGGSGRVYGAKLDHSSGYLHHDSSPGMVKVRHCSSVVKRDLVPNSSVLVGFLSPLTHQTCTYPTKQKATKNSIFINTDPYDFPGSCFF